MAEKRTESPDEFEREIDEVVSEFSEALGQALDRIIKERINSGNTKQ